MLPHIPQGVTSNKNPGSPKITNNLSNYSGRRRGETNEQVSYVLSLCFVGVLFLVVVRQTFLDMLVVFRCCYMLFHGCACCLVATWFCLGVATCGNESLFFVHLALCIMISTS